MYQVQVEALAHEAFAPYGQFYAMSAPKDNTLCGEQH